MINVKRGVRFKEFNGWYFNMCQAIVYAWPGKDKPTITSATDGKHSKRSLHYKNKALDVRTRPLDKSDQELYKYKLSWWLGKHYDVVLEKDHIHIEFDPE